MFSLLQSYGAKEQPAMNFSVFKHHLHIEMPIKFLE